MVQLGRLIFFCLLVSSSATQYARLTDQYYSEHLESESSSDGVTFYGSDARFQPIVSTEDYTLMSWVQIQERPGNNDTMIWKIEHGDFRVYLKYHRNNYFTICVSPNWSENVCNHVWPSQWPNNLWVHASIRIDGDTKQGHLCIIEWNGTSNCTTVSFSGHVRTMDNNSYLTYGASAYWWWSHPSPKMQVVDGRYYVGFCLDYSDIWSIYANTGCHSSCSGCFGPGTYACNDFIQLIDPNDGWTGNGGYNSEGNSYKRFDTQGSFMMNRSWSGNSTAFTGWLKCSYIHHTWVNLFRANNVDDNGCGSNERIPAIFHHPSYGYHFCHCRGNGQNVINTGRNTGYGYHSWHFVSFSTWLWYPQMEACYSNSHGSVGCATDNGWLSYNTVNSAHSNAHLWVGDRWYQGPACQFRDVRYYHAQDLSQNQVHNIKAALGCRPNCSSCSNPEYCNSCRSGFVQSGGWCYACSYGCQSCTSQTRCSSCVTGYQLYNNLCYRCHDQCKDCTNAVDHRTYQHCSVCMNDSYELQERRMCYTECPTRYTEVHKNNAANQCNMANNQEKAILFLFNKPSHSISNTGSASYESGNRAPTLTIHQSPPGGQPARMRGIYFDTSTSNYAIISNTILTHSFSVHMWVELKRTGHTQSFFSKDRNQFGSDHPNRLFDAYISSVNKVTMCVTKDYDHTNYQCVAQNSSGQPNPSNMSANVWYYAVFSFKDRNRGQYFDMDVWISNTRFINYTLYDFTIRDKKNWPMYFATDRVSPNGSLTSKMHCFISMIAVWQRNYSTSDNDHYSSNGNNGCSSCTNYDCAIRSRSCLWTENFTQYKEYWRAGSETNPAGGYNCHSSCALTGCVNHEACISESACQQLNGWQGNKYCNLCYDRECANCTTYQDYGCSVCDVSGRAHRESDGRCECDNYWGRKQWTSTDLSTYKRGYYCRQCWNNWYTCERETDNDWQENYYVCTECEGGNTNTWLRSGYKYCQEEQPTTYNWSSCVSSASTTNCQGLHYTFVNRFTTFYNEVGQSPHYQPTVSVHTNGASGLAGSYRGIWFSTSNSARINFNQGWVVRHTFAIYSWVWFWQPNHKCTLIAKDRNSTGHISFRVFILGNSKLRAQVSKDTDGSNFSSATVTNAAISNQTWNFLQIGFECSDHRHTYVTFYHDTSHIQTIHLTDHCLDDRSSWSTYIGATRTHYSNTFSNHFSGFIYDFKISQRARNDSDRNMHWKTSSCFPSGSSCPESSPAYWNDGVRLWEDMSNVNMWDTYYNHWYGTTTQCRSDYTGGNGVGCRREAAYIGSCNTGAVSGNYCHMCYDWHCSGCKNHHYGGCETSCQKQASHNSGSGICTCDWSFEGIAYTREDTTSPCCARHCSHCTNEELSQYCLECCPGDTTGAAGNNGECIEVTRVQPGFTLAHNGFVVCSPTCPSGYYLSGNTCYHEWWFGSTMIVDWDMTWILRPIHNYAPNRANYWEPDNPPSSHYKFKNAQPYKLRGTWFGPHHLDSAAQETLVVNAMMFRHVFTFIWWSRLTDTSGTKVLFCKDKGDTELSWNNGAENVFEIQIVNRYLRFAIRNHYDTWHTATSSTPYINTNDWHFLATSIYYNGTNSTVKLYRDGHGAESVTYSSANCYVNDQTDFQGTSYFYLGTARKYNASHARIPENPMTGWIYFVKIWQEQKSDYDINILREGNNANCTGACTGHCPKYQWFSQDPKLNHCLWTVDRDKWEESTGTQNPMSCQIKATNTSCTKWQGCHRTADCNRCDDRLCAVCETFDKIHTACLTCITNAAKINGADSDCKCNDDYWFDDDYVLADHANEDYTDKCVPCDLSCRVCSSLSYQTCTECRPGYYLQERANTCLAFCPTGYSYWNPSTYTCDGSPGSNVVFQFKLEKWKGDFKYITELISDQNVLLLGNSDAWNSYDPFLDRIGDRFAVQFTQSSSQYVRTMDLISGSYAGYHSLMLNHYFTITAWIHPDAVSGTQTILAKYNEDSHVTYGEEQLISFGLSGNKIQIILTTSSKTEDASAHIPVAEDFTVTTLTAPAYPVSANQWVQIGVTMAHGITSDLILFKDGVQVHIQSPKLAIQFSDKVTANGYIGCGRTKASGITNCFGGHIYEILVYAVNQSTFLLQYENGVSAALIPDLTYDCPPDQYYNTSNNSCTACNTSKNTTYSTKTDTIEECSICADIKCTSCQANSLTQCMSCTSGNTLQPAGGPGSCSCSSGYYWSNVSFACLQCPSQCDVCHGALPWNCSVCEYGYYMQPDESTGTYSCTNVCPKGMQGDYWNRRCINNSSINANVLLEFDIINHGSNRNWSYDGIIYSAGEIYGNDASKEPWTYARRGIWLDGTDDVLTLYNNFYLHAQKFSFYAWVRPEVVAGTIFSKSYNDYSSSGTSDFLDIYLTGGELKVDIKAQGGTKRTADISGIVVAENWSNLGITMDYDRTAENETCNIQAYQNQVTRNLVALGPTAVYEIPNTDSAIGARLDSNGGSYQINNHYNGFIYSIQYYGGTVYNEATMNGFVISSASCNGVCNFCPSTNQQWCLWNCLPNEYYNWTEHQCLACNSNCPANHPNGWDGCVRAENCALCYDNECETCNGFYSWDTCTQCIAAASGNSNGTSNCSCPSGEYYSLDNHTCLACDSRCLTCTGPSNFECPTCATHTYQQPSSTFCYLFCATAWATDWYYDTCTGGTAIAIQVDFEEITQGWAPNWPIKDSAGYGVTFKQDSEVLRSLAVKDRGHYFRGDNYWSIIETSNNFYFHHTFTILAWIRPEVVAGVENVIFSKQKKSVVTGGTPAKYPLEDLYTLIIRDDGTVESTIFDEAILSVNIISASTVMSAKWQMISARAEYDGTDTTMDLWLNSNKETPVAVRGFYMAEYINSISILGAEYNHDTANWIIDNHFKGYFWRLEVWNKKLDDYTITSKVQCIGTGCPYYGQGNQACPTSLGGYCISECDIDTWINGGSCTACDASCGGNCVRASTDTSCTLCDNLLCPTCHFFESGNNADCQSCITNSKTTSPPSCYASASQNCNTASYLTDCACIDTIQTAGGPTECTCHSNCVKCTALDQYSCWECASGFFLQPGTDFCLDYCGFDYAEDSSQKDCNDINSGRIVRRFNKIDISRSGYDSIPAKHRGNFFNGSDMFLADTNNVIFHHTMVIDAFIRPKACTLGKSNTSECQRTIFSRDKGLHIGTSSEDYFSFYIREDARIEVYFQTLSRTVTGGSGYHERAYDGVWCYVAVRWAWYHANNYTQIYLRKNQYDMSTTYDYYQFTEDDKSWTSHIGKETETDNSFNAYNGKYYSGFMYEMGFSNKDISFQYVYKTSGCGGHCSNFCDYASNLCLSTCEITQWPMSDYNQSCGTCDGSCTEGCVRNDDCGLCPSYECKTCNGFDSSDTCSACYTGKTDSVAAPNCQCNDHPLGQWYSTVTDECQQCHPNCTSCFYARLSRESLLDCSNNCIANYEQHRGICEEWCPTGYSENIYSKTCTNLSVANGLVLHFNDFTQFVNTDTDNIYSLTAFRGSNSLFNDESGDPNDPLVHYMAGLYFDGADILQICPYNGCTSYFLMNYDQTVLMIIRPEMWSQTASTEDEYLLSKSDGTNDKWSLYLDQTTKELKLTMSGMKSVILHGSNSDQTITFGTLADNGAWISIAIVSELTTATTTAYTNTYRAYVMGQQLGSSQYIQDLYYKDEKTYYFTFGGTYTGGSINQSFRGNLYDLKIYNAVKSQGQILANEHMIRTNDDSWCPCKQCYNVGTCLNHCPYYEWFNESQVTCVKCMEECTYGCWRHDDCKLNHDEKCVTANSWTDCATCVKLSEKKEQKDPADPWMCECVDNSRYLIADDACSCNDYDNYKELNLGSCQQCLRYLSSGEVSAIYDESFTFLWLKFRIAVLTDRFTTQSCAYFVEATTLAILGTSPRCQWETLEEADENGNLVYLKVHPGKGATIEQDGFELIGSQLYTDEINCNYIPTNIQTFLAFPPTSDDVEILPTKASFKSNVKFSKACDDLNLDASGSSGGMQREMTYKWKITHKESLVQIATKLVNPSTPEEFKRTRVPRTEFVEVGIYIVELAVENWLGATSTSSAEVEVLGDDNPSLNVQFNAENRTLYMSSYREFDVKVTNNCEVGEVTTEATGKVEYVFAWSQTDGPAPMKDQGFALGSTKNKITLDKSFTAFGTYTITVQVTGGGYTGTASIELDVKRSDLYAKLTIPSGDVSMNRDQILDASGSSDPDGGALDYSWSCADVNANTCLDIYGNEFFTNTTMNNPTQTIAAQHMGENVTYRFSVTITPRNAEEGDTRTATKTVKLTAKDNDAPTLAAKDVGQRVRHNKRLRLQMSINGSQEIATQWKQVGGPTIDANSFVTPSYLSYLVIDKGKLNEGDTYTFELTASTSTSTTTGQLEFTVNTGPRSGTFSVSPSSGTELTTEFTLTADGWLDPEETDYPLMYGFKYLGADTKPVVLQRPLDNPTYTTVLPYTGLSQLTTVLRVIDSLGTPSTRNQVIEVYALGIEDRALKVTEKLGELKSENPTDLPARINSLAVTGGITTKEQMASLTEAYDLYMQDVQTFTPDTLDSGISAFKNLAKTEAASESSAKLLSYVDQLSKASEDTEGFTTDQANEVIEGVNSISSDPLVINEAVQEVIEKALKYMLPEETDFEYESESMTVKSKRTTPANLAEMESTLPNSLSKIKLPEGVLDFSTLSASNTQSFVDVRMIEYPPVEGPQGTLAKVIDYEILEVGYYENNEVSYFTEPKTVNITQTTSPIEITIEVSNMHPEYSPVCVYATAFNETTGITTWSEEGCELGSVSDAQGTVSCKCTHLSRFTAGEDLILPEPEPVVVVTIEEDDGSKTTTFPIMILFLGILILAIFISAVSVKIRRRQEHIRVSQQSADLNSPRAMRAPEKEFNPVIRIGDECKFDDSLFQFVDRSFAKSKDRSRTEDNSVLDITAEKIKRPYEHDTLNSPQNLLRNNEAANSQRTVKAPNYDIIKEDIWPAVTEPRKEKLDTRPPAKDIWPNVRSPAKETEPETGKLAAPRKGNNDTTFDIDDMDEDRSCCGKHLIWGKTRPWPSAINRSLIVCGSLIMEIAMIGVVYWSQYTVTESHTNDFSLDDLEYLREGAIGVVSALAGLSISSVLTIIHGKKESLGIALSCLFILLSTVVSGYLSIVFNQIWSLTWMFCFLVAAITELIIGQTIMMCVASAMFKGAKPS